MPQPSLVTLPWWHPERHRRRRPNLLARARLLAELRALFAARGFVEVETPALQVSPGLEPHLMAFATELVGPRGDRRPLYLHTSPEFAMKKLLVAGEERLFQIARVFRNNERAATHHPEFTMVEWYRAAPALDPIMADCEAILRAACAAVAAAWQRPPAPLVWRGLPSDPSGPFERVTVAEALGRATGIDLMAVIDDPDAPDIRPLAAAAAPLGFEARPGDRWDDLYFRIFLDRVEPGLGVGRPTFLTGYPISMAALSRPDPADPRLAERFELYVSGLELANAFGELTDPLVQRRRFEADMALKQRLYGLRYPIDEAFLAALEHGLPPSAGIALGLDRLIMLATGADHIEDVLWAPVAE